MKTTYEFWEAEMKFRVTGRARVGADGLVSQNCNHFTLTVVDSKHFGLVRCV